MNSAKSRSCETRVKAKHLLRDTCSVFVYTTLPTRRLAYTPDTKIPHAGTFEIIKEDHTLGNLLRM